jgi:hypothetical protein
VATERLRALTTAVGRRLLLVILSATTCSWYSRLRDTEPELLQSLTLNPIADCGRDRRPSEEWRMECVRIEADVQGFKNGRSVADMVGGIGR